MTNSTTLLSEWDLLQKTVSPRGAQSHAGRFGSSFVSFVSVDDLFKFDCCGVNSSADWGKNVPTSCCERDCYSKSPQYRKMVHVAEKMFVFTGSSLFTPNTRCWLQGCLENMKIWFEANFLGTGISVIIICIIEVTAGREDEEGSFIHSLRLGVTGRLLEFNMDHERHSRSHLQTIYSDQLTSVSF